MTAARPCPKCNTAIRYASGHCKMCKHTAQQARQAAARVNPRKISLRGILAVLPGTYRQIMADTGLSVCTVQKYVKALHAEQELHITRWQAAEAQGQPCPVYARGPGEDAPKPRPLLPPREKKAEKRNLNRAIKRRDVRLMAVRPVPDQLLPRALMAQRSAFLLGGVWQ